MNTRAIEGRKILKDLFGQESLERRDGSTNAFNRDVRNLSDEYCFGEIWSRPGLDMKTRSLVCLSMLTALNRAGPVREHVKGALSNGCTVEEIKEVFLQAVIYCGLPAGSESISIAESVFAEKGIDYK